MLIHLWAINCKTAHMKMAPDQLEPFYIICHLAHSSATMLPVYNKNKDNEEKQ